MSPASIQSDDLLRVQGLCTEFRGVRPIVAVDQVSFQIASGEVLGLVGESGCGKSVLVKSLIRILPPNGYISGGQVFWHGEDLCSASERRMRKIRGTEISIIFQNPQACLNPGRSVGDQLRSLIRYKNQYAREDSTPSPLDLLRQVRISDPERVMGLYPFECSGGMCQRILIAMALAGRPKLLIADEPTTSLDVTIQAQIIRLILDLKKELGMSILFVSHDLSIVSSICDRIAVMYKGKIVEAAASRELFRSPRHSYTRTLLDSSVAFRLGETEIPR